MEPPGIDVTMELPCTIVSGSSGRPLDCAAIVENCVDFMISSEHATSAEEDPFLRD